MKALYTYPLVFCIGMLTMQCQFINDKPISGVDSEEQSSSWHSQEPESSSREPSDVNTESSFNTANSSFLNSHTDVKEEKVILYSSYDSLERSSNYQSSEEPPTEILESSSSSSSSDTLTIEQRRNGRDLPYKYTTNDSTYLAPDDSLFFLTPPRMYTWVVYHKDADDDTLFVHSDIIFESPNWEEEPIELMIYNEYFNEDYTLAEELIPEKYLSADDTVYVNYGTNPLYSGFAKDTVNLIIDFYYDEQTFFKYFIENTLFMNSEGDISFDNLNHTTILSAPEWITSHSTYTPQLFPSEMGANYTRYNCEDGRSFTNDIAGAGSGDRFYFGGFPYYIELGTYTQMSWNNNASDSIGIWVIESTNAYGNKDTLTITTHHYYADRCTHSDCSFVIREDEILCGS
ncbi:MAG: hypothetical protein OCC49_14025 [Fibrobacterales bacterium]